MTIQDQSDIVRIYRGICGAFGRYVVLFGLFLCFYIFLGTVMSYSTALENNLFFHADNARVFADLTDIDYYHKRISVHPLLLLIAQPIVSLVEGLTCSAEMAVIIIEAICGAGMVASFAALLEAQGVSGSRRLLFSCLLGVSFSTMLFSAIPETFIFSGVCLVGFWAFAAHSARRAGPLSRSESLIVVFFGVVCFGVTITNYVSFLIGLVYLLKMRGLRGGMIFKRFLAINAACAVLVLFLCEIQHAAWPYCPRFWTSMVDSIFRGAQYEETLYMSFSVGFDKTLEWLREMLCYPLAAPDVFLGDVQGYPMILFGQYNIVLKALIVVFYAAGAVAILHRIRVAVKGDEPMLLFWFLVAALAMNLCLHYVYGPLEAFIYSPHYFFLVLAVLAISFDGARARGLRRAVFILIAAVVILVFCDNLIRFFNAADIAIAFAGSFYSRKLALVVALFVGVMFFVVAYLLRKVVHLAGIDWVVLLRNAICVYALVVSSVTFFIAIGS